MSKHDSRWTGDPRSQPKHSLPTPPPLPPGSQTPRDVVVHHEPPPIVASARRSKRRTAKSRKRLTATARPAFDLQVAEHDPHGHRESASWFSSIVIHLIVFAIIALLLVPADYGAQGLHTLTITFGDGSDAGAGATVTIDAGEADEKPVAVPVTTDGAEPASSSTGAKQGDSKNDSGQKIGGPEGPSGSFFGIETTGHEFVYILDMSGSMRGSRYRRASQELVRSVNELTEGQKFYVILFSDRYLQMFNENNMTPHTVNATTENKQRLATWIESAFRGGSTDPRDAVRLALRMNASAIFMLSDGKFRDVKPSNSNSVFRNDNLDVFQIVQAARMGTPIQSIAFEEPVACENMKRLSVITGGKYRFVGNQDNDVAEVALGKASDAMRSGDLVLAETLLSSVIDDFGNTESGWDARQRLARMLFERASEPLRNGDVTAAAPAIDRIVEIDPNAIVTREFQKPLISELMKLVQQQPPTPQSLAAIELVSSLSKRFSDSEVHREIAQHMIEQTRTSTESLMIQNKFMEAFVGLDKCFMQFPAAQQDKRLKITHSQLFDRLVARARSIKSTQGDEAYLTHLRNLMAATKETSLNGPVSNMMRSLAVEMSKASRTGIDENAKAARLQIAQDLMKEIGDPTLMDEAERISTQNELRARNMLRTATRVESSGDIKSAMNRYSVLVKTYPNTVAATQAKARFVALRQQTLRTTDNGDLALQRMIRDANAAKQSN
ncbi:MAG: hypothetical protein WBD20_08025 [Pirellulaceae bacterium]